MWPCAVFWEDRLIVLRLLNHRCNSVGINVRINVKINVGNIDMENEGLEGAWGLRGLDSWPSSSHSSRFMLYVMNRPVPGDFSERIKSILSHILTFRT